MAREDIEIGVNADPASRAIRDLQNQFTTLGRTVGASAKDTEKAWGRMEKSIGGFVAKNGNISREIGNQGKSWKNAAAGAESYEQRLQRIARLNTDSQGRSRDSQTGRFVSAAQAAERQARAIDILTEAEDRLGREQQSNLNLQSKINANQNIGASNRYSRQDELLNMRAQIQANAASGSGMFANGAHGLTGLAGAQKNVERFAEAINNANNSTRYALYDVSNSLAIAGVATAALGVGAIAAAAQFENSFAHVERTVSGTPNQLASIRKELVALSQDVPVSFEALTEIATLGGQMGISAGGISNYTRTIAMLTATTDLSGEAAGTALGRFKAYFSEAQAGAEGQNVTEQSFDSLASSILKVGVNSVATETGIVNVSLQIASMGSYAGLTASEVIGLSGALSSVGVPPELSRGVITRLFTSMGAAAANGGTKLNEFARVAGVSAEDFAAGFGKPGFGGTLLKFMSGLAAEGDNAVFTLNNLGITSVRDIPVLTRLATAANSAGEANMLLAQTTGDAAAGWSDNTELAVQYNKIAQTLVARITVLGQAFTAFFAALGQSSTGPLKDMVNGLIDFLGGITDLMSTPFGQWIGAAAVTVSLLAGALLLVGSGVTRIGGMMMGVSAAIQGMGLSARVATVSLTAMKTALITTGIGAVVVVLGTLIGSLLSVGGASHTISDLSGLMAAMKKDTESGAKGFAVFKANADATPAAASAAASEADNLSRVLNGVAASGAAAGKGLGAGADAAESAALVFGEASRDFVKNQLAMDENFTKASQSDVFVDYFNTIGADTEKAIEIAAKDGASGVREYFKRLEDAAKESGVNVNKFMAVGSTGASSGLLKGDVSSGFEAYVSALDSVLVSGQEVVNQQSLLAEGVTSYGNATDIASQSVDELVSVNEKMVKSMTDGFAKFTEVGSLISLTQARLSAEATIDDPTTDLNEQAEAIANNKQAWIDYYGGTKFSLEDYMTTFRAAGQEQTAFMDNLANLEGRGLSTAIIADLAAMGPEASALIQGLVDSTDVQLQEFETLWGTTGYDSMVAYAANMLAAETLVQNVLKSVGSKGLKSFTDALRNGTPVDQALRDLQLNMDGTKLKPKLGPVDKVEAQNSLDIFLQKNNNRRITMWVDTKQGTQQAIRDPSTYKNGKNYATGGFTGAGGKYEPAGTVHRGEFVMHAEATKRIGIQNLYAMMGGSTARPSTGRGYAGGGAVTGFSTLDGASVAAIAAAIASQPLVLYSNDKMIAEAANRGNAALAYGGTA